MLFAVALGAVVLRERVTPCAPLGAVLIVAGVALVASGLMRTRPCYPALTYFHRFGEMGAWRPFFMKG